MGIKGGQKSLAKYFSLVRVWYLFRGVESVIIQETELANDFSCFHTFFEQP